MEQQLLNDNVLIELGFIKTDDYNDKWEKKCEDVIFTIEWYHSINGRSKGYCLTNGFAGRIQLEGMLYVDQLKKLWELLTGEQLC